MFYLSVSEYIHLLCFLFYKLFGYPLTLLSNCSLSTYKHSYVDIWLYVHILGHHLSIRASIIYKPTCLSVNIPSITNPSGNQSLLPFVWQRLRQRFCPFSHSPYLPLFLSWSFGSCFHYKCNNFKPAFCKTTTTNCTTNTSLTPHTNTNAFAHQVTVTQTDADKHRFYGRERE